MSPEARGKGGDNQGFGGRPMVLLLQVIPTFAKDTTSPVVCIHKTGELVIHSNFRKPQTGTFTSAELHIYQ